MKPQASLLVFPLLFLYSHSFAQGRPQPTEPEWSYSLGAGMITAPSYLGDNAYQLSIVPNLRVSFGDTFFASVGEGLGFAVVNENGFRAGPIIKYNFGRKEDGSKAMAFGDDTDDLRGLGDVDGTIEAGGFAQYRYEKITTKLELRQALGGHEGFVGEATMNYGATSEVNGQRLIYSAGPVLRVTDSQYNQSFFGVNTRQSAASGLAQYDANSTVSFGLGGKIIIPHTPKLSTLVLANYSRLGKEIAHSSLVKERGNPNQFLFGCFVSFQF